MAKCIEQHQVIPHDKMLLGFIPLRGEMGTLNEGSNDIT